MGNAAWRLEEGCHFTVITTILDCDYGNYRHSNITATRNGVIVSNFTRFPPNSDRNYRDYGHSIIIGILPVYL